MKGPAMKNQLQNFVDQAFHPYGDFPAQADVKQELLSNLEEKYDDFIKAGKTERKPTSSRLTR
jgi:hypothetical protein